MFSTIKFEYTSVLLLLIFLNIDGYPHYEPYHHHHDHYGGYNGGSYYSSGGPLRCFSGDSLVKLSNGQDKQIDSLNIGDEILTIDQSNLIPTPVILMLDKHTTKKALFYILKTSCSNQISLTEYHLLPIISDQGNLIYKIAKEIQIGDFLFGLFNEKLNSCRVNNITNEIKEGYYAPLTMKGTLLVNGILASSFAHVSNHQMAQFYMFPFRYYYKLTRFMYSRDVFDIYNADGSNWLIKTMFDFARYVYPEILVLS